MNNGIKNLEKVNYKVDYVIFHCCPTNIQALLGGGTYKKDYLTDYLQKISEKLEFKKWYFGHSFPKATAFAAPSVTLSVTAPPPGGEPSPQRRSP